MYGLYWADIFGNFTQLIGVYNSPDTARLVAFVKFPCSTEHDDFVVICFVTDAAIE